MDFETWMAEVARIIQNVYGFDYRDLDDYHYHDDWEDDMAPEDTAEDAVDNAGMAI